MITKETKFELLNALHYRLFDTSESWHEQNIGMHIAYLSKAILTSGKISLSLIPGDSWHQHEFLQLLSENFEPDSLIWQFVIGHIERSGQPVRDLTDWYAGYKASRNGKKAVFELMHDSEGWVVEIYNYDAKYLPDDPNHKILITKGEGKTVDDACIQALDLITDGEHFPR